MRSLKEAIKREIEDYEAFSDSLNEDDMVFIGFTWLKRLSFMYFQMPKEKRNTSNWFYDQRIETMLYCMSKPIFIPYGNPFMPPGSMCGSYPRFHGRPMIAWAFLEYPSSQWPICFQDRIPWNGWKDKGYLNLPDDYFSMITKLDCGNWSRRY